ncbi:Na+/H+ antiporter NhaA [Desertivirga arenae]|uniref:Na+/H+ antiporter NhaA n=1 Tax=Desertivirga arenae TaxID=2810309 RepID=UPI001A960255|nr:Na+/H+ antiporter NhaA [Pedobacter sp. SYSU D00823]
MARLININAFREFVRSGQTGGLLLLLSVIVSLIIANSVFAPEFHHLLQFSFGIKSLHLQFSLETWINDALMSVFFLLVGLEIKRELLEGELSSFKKAALPIFAALGGMIMPAVIFSAINRGHTSGAGWGIPMATDIAFALALISMLGKKVPTSLKVFLAALAIVDDLGAIIVIALFYTASVNLTYLLYAGGIITFLFALNLLGVKNLVFYLIPGALLWYFIHGSGIHATIAGVLLAFTIPTNPVKETSSLERLEHVLQNPVNFFIMPLFALANTSIRFESSMLNGLTSPLGIGIILGLVLGKSLGISTFSFLAVKSGLSELPARLSWKHIFGVSLLGGIGFTMSVFIALLSFKEPKMQTEAKFAILCASILAGFLGFQYLNMLYRTRKEIHYTE